MKKQFWTFWRSTKSMDIGRSGDGFGRRICKVGKGAEVENLLFYSFFCASVDVGRFFFCQTIGIHQPFEDSSV